MKATVTKYLRDNQAVLTTEAGREIVINLEDSREFVFVYEDDPDPVDNYVDGHMTACPLVVGDEVIVKEITHGQYTVSSVNLKKGDRRNIRPGT
jgi:hypothetical protein